MSATSSTPSSWPSARSSASRAYIPAGDAARILDASRCCARPRARRSRCWAAASSSTAAATPRWTSRAPRAGSAPTRRWSSTGAPASGCPHTTSRSRRRSRRVFGCAGCRRSCTPARPRSLSRRCGSTTNGFPQPTGEFEELDADAVVLALGQDADLSLVDRWPGLRDRPTVSSRSRPDMMTGHAGLFAGGDMVPRERTVTVAVGHGKKAARNIDAWLRGTTCYAPSRPELASYDQLNTWYYADAPATVRPQLDIAAPRRRPSTRWSGGLDRTTRSSRHDAACRAATASNATTATASAPTTRSSSSARASATRSTTTTARAAGSASPSARAGRSTWFPSRSRGRCPALTALTGTGGISARFVRTR